MVIPAFLLTILALFGKIATDLPQIEAEVGAIWTFLAAEYNKLFGPAVATTQMKSHVAIAQDEVRAHDLDKGAAATAWLKQMYPTVDALLAEFPGLAPELSVRYNTVKAGATHAMAAKVVQTAHALERIADPAYQSAMKAMMAAKP
jgi:hypothetical protein